VSITCMTTQTQGFKKSFWHRKPVVNGFTKNREN
jgi:hypothetical protein